MYLRYLGSDGQEHTCKLGEKEVIVGRSRKADIFIDDSRVSRKHAGIRYWGGDYVIKDLQSNNGTWVNGRQINVMNLTPGDRIVIGAHELIFEDEAQPQKGTRTIFAEVGDEFDHGKGYSTIMREVVNKAGKEGRRSEQNPGSDESSKKDEDEAIEK